METQKGTCPTCHESTELSYRESWYDEGKISIQEDTFYCKTCKCRYQVYIGIDHAKDLSIPPKTA